MLCKYILDIGNVSYELSNSCIKNWDEIKFSYKRTGLEGITRTFTSKFQFVGEAYDLLLYEYLTKYLASSANITVYIITNTHAYKELFSCRLDFCSLIYDETTVFINSIDDSVADIIKANKGTEYEYSVDILKEDATLNYDGINMRSIYKFTMGDYVRLYPGSYATNMYIYSYSNEIIKPYLEPDTGEIYVVAIVEGVPQGGLDVIFDVDISLVDPGISGWRCADYFHITMHGLGHDYTQRINKGETQRVRFEFTITKDNFDSSGDKKLYLNLKDFGWGDGNRILADIYINKIYDFTISYRDRRANVLIDVVKPVTLLNCLLKSMNGGNDGITCEIASGVDERLDNCVLIAAESIRGIIGAKIYTSYKKFMDWMEAVFGFVPVVDGSIVRFIHRKMLFEEKKVKDIGNDVSDFEYKIDESRIYSRIRVGYDKQDYESINGRDEFRFTTEYTTGVTITENALELISPYRADAYGIEFLSQKRGENTTDNDSDNDVFFVGASFHTEKKLYELIRTGWEIGGILSPNTMFNTMYWQGEMINANAGYIGMFADKLHYSSSDGNSDVVVNGVGMTDDILVEDQIVTCGDISFKTFDEDVPRNVGELVKIENAGLVYEGYIKEVSRVIERFAGVKYDLFVRSIIKV